MVDSCQRARESKSFPVRKMIEVQPASRPSSHLADCTDLLAVGMVSDARMLYSWAAGTLASRKGVDHHHTVAMGSEDAVEAMESGRSRQPSYGPDGAGEHMGAEGARVSE